MVNFEYIEDEITRSKDPDLFMLIGRGSFLMPNPTSKYWNEIFPQRCIKKFQTVQIDKPFAEEYISHDEMIQRYFEVGLKI